MRSVLTSLLLYISTVAISAPADLVWTTPSNNSSESMPCGGGDIGLNVWVTADGFINIYICRSGSFDENNTLLKSGKLQLRLSPSFDMSRFKQTLHLNDGNISIEDGTSKVDIWVDVFKPVIHVEVESRNKTVADMSYVNWRTTDHPLDRNEGQQCSYKWTANSNTKTTKDTVRYSPEEVCFYHQNSMTTVFDRSVEQQGLGAYKVSLYNPLSNLIFGGRLRGLSTKPSKKHHFFVTMASVNGSEKEWTDELEATESLIKSSDKRSTRLWWNEFWRRSFIETSGENAFISRNYSLFRYLLGCNAHSDWPTKFNGGLFTFDPKYIDEKSDFTPDFRKWGGGTHTAQNQRLVYWPLLQTGDFDLMRPQFEFYRRILSTAEIRSKVYWGHEGGCFAEQIENFGLPNYAEYGTKRPDNFDKGVEYNAWLEYEWDTVLEFCQMILLANDYGGMDINPYLPLIRSVISFFDNHYQYLAKQRGRKGLDEKGRLIIFPGSACETYKMAYNPSSTIAGLKTLAETYMEIVDTVGMADFLNRIPEIPLRVINGKEMISPAVTWERVNNVETPQLYPVFPWKRYCVGKPDIDIAINTYECDSDAVKFRSHIGWKQDNIWAACLGMTKEAFRLTKLKLADGPYRFPAFWGPGYDWSPDHNWGGSAMLGLQYMLMQENASKIILFPAWPMNEDVHFKLHASKNTTVEVNLKDGKITQLDVFPESRKKDILIWQDYSN